MYRFLISLILVSWVHAVKADSLDVSVKKNLVGVELLKPAFMLLTAKGFVSEGVYIRKLVPAVNFRTVLNYSDVNFIREGDANVRVNGVCLKPGIDFITNPRSEKFNFAFGLSGYWACYNDERRYISISRYMDKNYISKSARRREFMRIGGAELAFRWMFRISERISTELSSRFNLNFYSAGKFRRAYYIPGYGYNFYGNVIRNFSGDRQFACGTDLKILWRF